MSSSKMVDVQVPELIFRKVKHAAEMTYRPVEEIVAATLDAALPEPAGLPPELADELASMHILSDEALRAAMEPSLSPTEQHRLGQLNDLAGQRDLTKAEEAEQAQLLAAYHRSILRRAQAMSILHQRGLPVPSEEQPQAVDDGGA